MADTFRKWLIDNRVTNFSVSVLLACFLVTPLVAFSQKRNLKFNHIGTNDGLSQSNVICIFQDSRGFMWFGTRDGLNKYDGYKITAYRNDIDDPSSLSNNTINDITEDKKGNLWIATWNGINVFDRQRGTFTSLLHDTENINSPAGNLVNCLLTDSKGKVWIGLEGAGVDVYDPLTKQFNHFRHNTDTGSLSSDIVKDIFEDHNKDIWIGTFRGGINRFDRKTGRFNRFMHKEGDPSSLSHNNVWKIFEDSQHRLWIGTMGGGINQFDPLTEDFKHYPHLPRYILAIGEDWQKNIWLGAENDGLTILDTREKITGHYLVDETNKTGLNNNSIWSIYRDTKGNMWVGTFSGGVNFFNRDTDKFKHYQRNSSPNSLSHNNVLAVFEDAQGKLWIGTDGGGVNLYDPRSDSFTHFRHEPGNPNSLSGNYVLCIEEDHEGNLWMGTWGDGITVFNPKTNSFKRYQHNPHDSASLASNNAWVIFEDSEQHIWVGTYSSGLDRYDPQTDAFIHHRYSEGIKNNITSSMINEIYEDSDKNLWIGTNGGGLNLFDRRTNRFESYRYKDRENGISDNIIYSITEDERGDLWIGTAAGLNIFDKKARNFTTLHEQDGLPNGAVFGILEDDRGNLWISTNKGIARYEKQSGSFTNYSIADGLQAYEFKQAACKTRDGRMYFGGINGLNEFHPDSIKEIEFDPPLVITDFQIFNKPVPISAESEPGAILTRNITEASHITLSYEHSVISFEFASLNYTVEERKKYAYMLEGFDKEWNYVGTKRTATYTNLNPGKYAFRIKGVDNQGNWSPRTVTLRINITPPFWATAWFRLLALFLVSGSVIGVYRYRLNVIKRQKAALEREVKERTEKLAIATLEERKAREEAEKARLEAEQANLAKSIFLATMSHEIRTPMNGVIGMASLLNETKLNEEQKEYAETIRSCGESLLGVINDILDFSKIESGKMDLEQKDFNLRTVIEEVFDLFAGKAAHAGLDLIYQIDHNVPSQIVGDSLRVKQVLINLIGNAVKFTHKGEIFLGVKLVRTTGDKAELSFQVRDTGIGIPAHKLDKLFKAFSQIDSSTTRKYGGTGLGLAICEKLVQLMDGSIEAESVVSQGTTFTFTITAGVSVQAIKTYVHANMAALEGKQILIVDDNATNRTILKAQMEQWKCTPVLAASAHEALDILSTADHHFDLILTDMKMPDVSGVQLAEHLKHKNIKVPVMLLSSVGDERSREFKDLFSSVLTKPVKQNLLLTQMLHLLREKQIHHPAQHAQQQVSERSAQHLAIRIPLHVLLVDDNPVNQKLAGRIFSKLGYGPEVAANGNEALEAIQKNDYDLIMMDIQMPELDGIEATRIIRGLDIKQPVIIAMTANAMESDREACIQAGMDDYISKPIKLDDMLFMIEKWAKKINAKK